MRCGLTTFAGALAAARVEEAAGVLREAGAGLVPAVEGSAGDVRERFQGDPFDLYSVGASTSYELDPAQPRSPLPAPAGRGQGEGRSALRLPKFSSHRPGLR